MSSDPSPDRTVLVAYLTRHVSDCHQAAHAARLADTLRYEPYSPTCANWLRYGIQAKNPWPNPRPGCGKGKAHRREYLGYADHMPTGHGAADLAPSANCHAGRRNCQDL